MPTRFFRHPDGALPNTLALAYALAGYAGGLWLMATASWPWALAATLWFAHALIISAYLFHEFAHGTVFLKPEVNTRGGVLMTWLTGSCYARYEHLRRKHMRTTSTVPTSSVSTPRRCCNRPRPGCDVACWRWNGPMYRRWNC